MVLKVTDLSLVSQLDNKAADRKRRLVSVTVVNTLGSHVPRQNTAVGGETGDSDADVVVDLEDLLLVRRELGVGLVNAAQDHVSLRSEPNCGGALLNGLHGVLHLK